MRECVSACMRACVRVGRRAHARARGAMRAARAVRDWMGVEDARGGRAGSDGWRARCVPGRAGRLSWCRGGGLNRVCVCVFVCLCVFARAR